MKKTIISIVLIIGVLAGIGAFVVFRTPGKSDQYDRNNYIGSADISIAKKVIMGVTREDMSAFTIDGESAYMSGYISSDTIRQVKKLIGDYPRVKTINMKDVGGSIDDISNLEASRLVRQAGLNTHLDKDGHVASGGTDFFCAGVKRTAEEGAKVGIHSWAGVGVDNAALLPEDHVEHQKYIDYYTEMGMGSAKAFYFYTINAATADDIYYMTTEELIEYELVN